MKWSKNIRLRIGHRLIGAKVILWNSQVYDHTGITNQTPDGQYIPFWDFQEPITKQRVIDALKEVQQDFGLSTIYVLQTYPRDSYRAFCLDVVDFMELVQILSSTTFIDPNYLRFFVIRKKSVIRVTEKPNTENKVIEIIGSWMGSILRDQSASHAMFFSKLYGLDYGWDFTTIKERVPLRIKLQLSKYETFR